MRKAHRELSNFKNVFRVLALIGGLCAIAVLVSGFTRTAPSFTISLVNNSDREIRHLYLSTVDNDNWGADQLSGAAINPGSTRTIQASWELATVKVVAEDQDGCFLTTTVEAAGSPAWTITSDTARDCGN